MSRQAARLRRIWRSRRWPAWALWPLAALYAAISGLRRWLYRSGCKRSSHPGIICMVIGNVIAGGAGKTPVTLATVRHLQAQGWRPGIVSRGYGRSRPSQSKGQGQSQSQDCVLVNAQSLPQEVGDEPYLLARATGVPVAVAAQRVQAAQALRAAHPEVNILLCDDGLQHLALARDIEVCVFNDEGVGNGWLLPAGPLREPWPRPVDVVLYSHQAGAPTSPAPSTPSFWVQRRLQEHGYNAQGQTVALHTLAQHPRLYAVAAIARPEDFFTMLRALGLHLHACLSLPDHHPMDREDFAAHPHWPQPKPASTEAVDTTDTQSPIILCTEKDASKLWPLYPQALAVPLHLHIQPDYFAWLDARLSALTALASSHP
ncbi:MAG: tetraacyldisaccharide 4'-kinase [Comamonas sp.]|nr:tetraacyldisaccharide 4'-kinase [Comamonas sp.]